MSGGPPDVEAHHPKVIHALYEDWKKYSYMPVFLEGAQNYVRVLSQIFTLPVQAHPLIVFRLTLTNRNTITTFGLVALWWCEIKLSAREKQIWASSVVLFPSF